MKKTQDGPISLFMFHFEFDLGYQPSEFVSSTNIELLPQFADICCKVRANLYSFLAQYFFHFQFILTVEGRGGKFNLKNTILNIGSGMAFYLKIGTRQVKASYNVNTK